MTRIAILLLLASLAHAGELPDAPHLKMRPPEVMQDDGPFQGENNIVHNLPTQVIAGPPRNLDWRFITAHGVYAGAVAFDLLETSRGVSHGCAEASSNLGPHPSDKKLIAYGLIEFSLITTMDYFLKRSHVPGLSYVGAGIGTFKHVRGGYKWTRTGCL